MKLRLGTLHLAAMVLCLASPSIAQTTSTAQTDLTGKWLFSVTTDGGTGTPTLTFVQKGDSLTGHYSSQLLGEQDFKGAVKGNQFNIWFTINAQGQSANVTYAGSIEADGSLKGTMDLGGYASGTFTAKKQP